MFFTVPKLSSWLCELPVTIIQESTYGTMNSSEIEECFEQNILSGIREKKTIVIPAFSLGRYQEVLYFLKQLQEKNALDINVPIYADGKLAAAYTNMFLNNPYLGIDLEMTSFLPENVNFIFDSETRSNVIADMHSKIIVTTSGMGSYGPAQEYISKLISSSNALIHFTGYTAEGTLGRRLKDTEINQNVRIGSLMKIKRAEVMYTTEFSAHAKADEMIDFLNDFNHINFIIVNHGEPEVKEKFASRILREVNNVKEVGISSRDTFFRIDPYKCVKSMSTHFQ
jgi:metallo-beta-lactamase superfamily